MDLVFNDKVDMLKISTNESKVWKEFVIKENITEMEVKNSKSTNIRH